jgi:hypothetical protein
MARPEDAVYFRRAWGSVLRDPRLGHMQAFLVAPLKADMEDETRDRILAWTYQGLLQAFEYGTTFYVADDIGALLERVMERSREKRVFHFEEQDFQGTQGMLYLDWPFLIPNGYSKTGYQRVIALGWTGLYGRYGEDEPDRQLGVILWTVVEKIPNLGGAPDVPEYFGHTPYITRHRIPIIWNERLDPDASGVDTYAQDMGFMERETRQERLVRAREEQEGSARILRLLYAWAMFAQTEVTASESHYLNRAMQKSFTREGRPLPEIRVVRLRRYADDPERREGETLVEWSHRWEVRGHMRQIKVHRDSTETRWVHVRKHIKGPASKPLVLRDTVEAYVR